MSSKVSLTRLEYALHFANGRSSPDRDEGARYPVYGSNGLIGRAGEKNSEPKTIVIGRVGSYCGSVHFSKDACWVTDNAIRATAKGDHDPAFLYYLLKHLNLNSWRSGSGQPLINQATLNAIEAPIPEPSEQRVISGLIGAFDDRITLLRETNTTLEAIAQALFKSWFVDFDPVRAKMAGRAPEGMDEATAALFPDALEETELGVVPKGWKLVPFGDLLSHTIGGDWGSDAPDEKNDTRVAIIRGTDIPDLQSGGASRVPVRYTSAKKLASRAIQDGDIVLEVSGGSKDQPTGRSLYMTEALLGKFECPVEPASFCRLFRPTSIGLGVLLSQHLKFIYAAGKTWEYQNQSTGIANFQTTHFLEKELVAVPGEEVLDSFASLVRPMVDRVHAAQISELSELRDTLLPRLISGQLHLPEAQAQLEEALA
jgi:type I restriction enzyme S subunit